LLSAISIVVGLTLIAGAIIGGNIAAELNAVVGVLFLLSGLANLAVLRTSANILNFSVRNVIFSFVSGLLLLTFGLYGRVSGGLPPDNPFYRARHGLDPATGEVVDPKKATGMSSRPRPPRPARPVSAESGCGRSASAGPDPGPCRANAAALRLRRPAPGEGGTGSLPARRRHDTAASNAAGWSISNTSPAGSSRRCAAASRPPSSTSTRRSVSIDRRRWKSSGSGTRTVDRAAVVLV
jgi:hypothetical protein